MHCKGHQQRVRREDARDKGELPEGSVVEDINPERGLLVIFYSVLVQQQKG
jgi:hypothetical protein